MSNSYETSDARLLDLLQARGPLSIGDMAEAGGVTATAIRQRLTRLMSQGLIEREAVRAEAGARGRGRPEHRYSLTEKARRQAGNNYADLAVAMWQEIRNVKDADVRRGLLERIARHMTLLYRDSLNGSTPAERMESLRALFADRRVPLELVPDAGRGFPALEVVSCPYPELAAQDRSVCAMEKMMFQDLLDQPLKLSQCRLDGHDCCRFEAPAAAGCGSTAAHLDASDLPAAEPGAAAVALSSIAIQ